MNVQEAADVVQQFKDQLEMMRHKAKPGDTIPAEVFFNFMDILVPSFDVLITEVTKNKEQE